MVIETTPINYGIGSGNPVGIADFTSGLGLGQQMGLGAQAARTAEQTRTVEAQKQAAHQAMMQEIAGVSRMKGGATSDAIIALQIKYPQMAENLKKSLDAVAPAEKQERIGQLSSIVAAGKAGNVNLAIDLLKRNATAYRNAGRDKDAQAMEDNARLLEESPEDAMFTLESALAANLGPEKYMDTVRGMGTLDSDVAKARSDADKTAAEALVIGANAETQLDENLARIGFIKEQTNRLRVQSALEAKRLDLDEREFAQKVADALTEAGVKAAELTKDNMKLLSEAATDATFQKEQSRITRELAKELESGGDPASGVWAEGKEYVGDKLGFTTNEARLRKKFVGMREKLIAAELKGMGSASEGERKSFREGFPQGSAPLPEIARYLNGNADNIDVRARAKQAEVDFLAANKDLGPAKAPMVIRGVQVQQGERYDQFVDRLEAAASATKKAPARAAAAKKSYMNDYSRSAGAK